MPPASVLPSTTPVPHHVWARVECSVAFQVVAQKFMKSPELQELLLREGGLLAEMTRKDANWGTGIDRSEPREVKCNPSDWAGST